MAVVEPETVSGYRVTRTIARTAHGAVLIGHDPEAGVAVLKVRHGAEAIADTVREAAALQRGAGAHVVRLRDVATSPSAEGEDRGVLVLERCEGGTLAELLRRRRQFDAGEAVTLLAPVIASVGRSQSLSSAAPIVRGKLTGSLPESLRLSSGSVSTAVTT